MAYVKRSLGADPPAATAASVVPAATSPLPSLSDVSPYVAAALVYHGYRRTGSVFWALLYGLAGKEAPAIAGPIALAQGFGHKKPCP